MRQAFSEGTQYMHVADRCMEGVLQIGYMEGVLQIGYMYLCIADRTHAPYIYLCIADRLRACIAERVIRIDALSTQAMYYW